MSHLEQAHNLINQSLQKDKGLFKARLKGTAKIKDEQKREQVIQSIIKEAEQSVATHQHKRKNLPNIEFPPALPVSEKAGEIADAIKHHQVVIIAGETGSGKTTQIPKICLSLGRGISGIIGHTQPRRLAARSVCARIAEELNDTNAVGYKIRFNETVSENSYIKLMTDGILLAEIQKDRMLWQYDTIIIDEAHERSLNIDFILGYLKQLLPKRKDLKVIITSATIDPQRFSTHFSNAPIIEVSGRTYPVEVRYRPVQDVEMDEERDQLQAIIDAVDELSRESMGDILVFMNGEREIRDTADALQKCKLRNTEILPLYARLASSEQNRIFQPGGARRIILSTNVAETSLTVPGIKFVIDPGTARISRYSYRTKVQRLPIEKISQASANQRKGRCGRVSDGICIRLYDEDDFLNRPEFTDPEILRTNLASVILQMLSLGLGEIAAFPFVEPPDSRNINDGLRLLEELQAIKTNTGKQRKLTLTDIGRQLSAFPIDPRLARMLMAGKEHNALQEMLVLCAALSIQDPRERPHDAQQKSDISHQRFADERSDFVAFLNLWEYVETQQKALTKSQFRKLCRQEYLAYMRVREWQDVHLQLRQICHDKKWRTTHEPADYTAIHKAIISGFLTQTGMAEEKHQYLGTRNTRYHIFPGSGLFSKQPKWMVSAELVETSKLYARINAKIEPEWIEPLCQHLVKRSWSEPTWSKKRGQAQALERQSLFGLPIVVNRKVDYGNIDPAISQQLLISEGLVQQQINGSYRFLQHNQTVIERIQTLENKSRRRDILVDEMVLVEKYQERLPRTVVSQADLTKWIKHSKENDKSLWFSDADLMTYDPNHLDQQLYPDVWIQDNITLPIKYHFEPSGDVDGAAIIIPIALLNQVNGDGFDWGIPGFRHELITALIRSLPKVYRRNYVPAPDYAEAALQRLDPDDTVPMLTQLETALFRMTGNKLPEKSWDLTQIPKHLRINFVVVDEKKKTIASGDSVALLKQKLQGKITQALTSVASDNIEQQGLTEWTFGQLPTHYTKRQGGYDIRAFPALVDDKSSVAIKLFDNELDAQAASRAGIRRLVLLNIPSPVKYLQESLPNKSKLGLYFNPFGTVKDIINDCIHAGCDQLIQQFGQPVSEADFTQCREKVREEIGDRVLQIAIEVEKVLNLAYQINKVIKKKADFSTVHAYADLKQQLSRLVFKGFVTQHGVSKIADIQRYLAAGLKRLEKLAVDPNKDRLHMIELDKVDAAFTKAEQQFALQREKQVELAELRWMQEELRVSFFAQTIGTKYPISAKRIYQQIKSIEAAKAKS